MQKIMQIFLWMRYLAGKTINAANICNEYA